MKFLWEHKPLLGLLLAVVLALGLAVWSFVSPGGVSPLTSWLGAVFQPLQSFATGVADSVSSLTGYQREYEDLLVENERLRIRIAEMEQAARDSVSANEENARFRELFGFAERRRDFVLESAYIIARDTSNWSRTLTLERGENHGVKPGMAVLGSEGYLVGVIAETSPTWSTVTTVVDTDMEAGARVYSTQDAYVAEGDFDLMRQGLLRLSYLPTDVNLRQGDLILTSGIGGLLPRDLEIGTVLRVETENNGIDAFAVVTPRAQLDKLTQVFVVKSFEITE